MSNTTTEKLDYCCSSLKLAMDMGGIQYKFVNGLGLRFVKYVLLLDESNAENIALFKEGIIEKMYKKDKIETAVIKPISITGYKFLLDILEYCSFCGKKLVNKTILEMSQENHKYSDPVLYEERKRIHEKQIKEYEKLKDQTELKKD